MSGAQGGWRPYPGARRETAFRLAPVEPGRIVGLGATCDLGPSGTDPADHSFTVSEFVVLEDGRRVVLHEDRGFTVGARSTGERPPGDVRSHLTLDDLAANALLVVLPDDEGDTEPHPWSWLADLARSRGLDVTAEELRGLPYDVDFTAELRRWIAGA